MTPTASYQVNGTSNGHSASKPSFGFATRAIHVGSEPNAETGAVIPPISLSTTFAQDGVGNFKVSRLADQRAANRVSGRVETEHTIIGHRCKSDGVTGRNVEERDVDSGLYSSFRGVKYLSRQL